MYLADYYVVHSQKHMDLSTWAICAFWGIDVLWFERRKDRASEDV